MTQQSFSQAASNTLVYFFGDDPADSASLAELLGLPLPHPEDSVSTQTIIEKLLTEATLLKASLGESSVPSIFR